MNFSDGSLWPENQQKLVITAAPYAPEWMPSDFPEDIPVTMEQQIQKAVDCYNAGATVGVGPPAGPGWVEEHVRRLSARGVQSQFQLCNITHLETLERMMRRGACNVPLILTWVAIGGGFDAPNLYNLANFVRACPD